MAPPPVPLLPLCSHDDADRHCQRKEKDRALAWKPSGLAFCYGYGAPMQTAEDAAPEYNACCKRTVQMFQIF